MTLLVLLERIYFVKLAFAGGRGSLNATHARVRQAVTGKPAGALYELMLSDVRISLHSTSLLDPH